MGSRTVKGYGQLKGDGSALVRAHRAAWTVTFGPIPEGVYVLHSCDNPPCCNPHHLWLGTALDNTRDIIAKGRPIGRYRTIVGHTEGQ